MGKIPYLFRRKNVFYFRLIVPIELQALLNFTQVTVSLKTQNSEEAISKALLFASRLKSYLYDVKHGNRSPVERSALVESLCLSTTPQSSILHVKEDLGRLPQQYAKSSAPLLSIVIEDFLLRYNPKNRATLIKLKSTLPIFLELVGDKPVNRILQADINEFFDQVQMLPIRRDAKVFSAMTIKQIIVANDGRSIAEGTFDSTYRACASLLINWAMINYKDQGFPVLTTKGAIYRGNRSNGINKQRALKLSEIEAIFMHPKMKKYADNPDLAHYYWLPLVGLFTGCRINEVCQLNPFLDIRIDDGTGIHYFHFNDEGDTDDDVIKSIKTKSSKRIVPIHSKLIELGFLDYLNRLKCNNQKIIFPAWSPRNGKASTNASRWFIRYLDSIGIRDNSDGLRLSGYHCFRHTFITNGIKNGIPCILRLTGHESDTTDAVKISSVAKGYWSRELTDHIEEKKLALEMIMYKVDFYKPIVK